MVENLSQDLFSSIEAPPLLSDTTGLPIAVWSLSTKDFVKKFTDIGLSAEKLIDLADTLEVAPSTIDEGLTDFMDEFCRDCDPNNEEHQYCVTQFATLDWQVECPARPDLANYSLSEE